MDDVKEKEDTRLKVEALDCPVLRNSFGRGCGTPVRQTAVRITLYTKVMR